MTVLNLFDQDQVTRRFQNRMVGSLPVSTTQFFAGGWDYEGILAANPNLREVRHNQPDQFQAPRQLRFNVSLQF